MNALIANKLSDFRGFCKLFFDSDREDILKFFNKDIEVQTLYMEISKRFDPTTIVKIYNDSLFYITSLTSRHLFLADKSKKRRADFDDLQRLKTLITEHSDELIEYLACAKIAERNQLDLTVEDLLDIRKLRAGYLMRDKTHV